MCPLCRTHASADDGLRSVHDNNTSSGVVSNIIDVAQWRQITTSYVPVAGCDGDGLR